MEFALVNIGGVRAENVKLELEGDFVYMNGRKRLSGIAVLNGLPIAHLSPAQVVHLITLDNSDLYARDESGKVTGIRKESFAITVRYDGPSTGVNRAKRWFAARRSRQQYASTFSFDTAIWEGLDLPGAEYSG